MEWSFATNETQLEALSSEWKALAAQHATDLQLFQTHTWVAHWWKHFASMRRLDLRVMVGRSSGELVAVWPLVRHHVGPFRLLEGAGGLLSCFDDALLHTDLDTADLEAAWKFLTSARGVDAIRLRGVHAQARIAPLLANHAAAVSETTSPFVDCEGAASFDAHWKKRSKRFRSEQRRSWRLLEAEGAVSVTPDDTRLDTDEAAAQALVFKRRWLAENGLSGKTIVSERGEAFMRSIGDALAAAGDASCSVSTVRIDDRLIAVGLSYRFLQRRYEYPGGFDFDYERCGPGRVQLEGSLRSSFEQGLRAHDFMTPSTPFKDRLADEAPTVSQFVVPVSLRGRLYRDLYVKRARPVLKRVYNRVLPHLRRRHA